MATPTPGPTHYRFDVFELRPDQSELLRNGVAVALQPQPLKVLTILVARAGSLVRREELVAEVWGEGTHVDFDRGLNYCIKQIRAALGDDATEPRFIRTMPRLGYRFVARVERRPETQAAPPAPTAAPRRSTMRRAATAAGTAFTLVAISLGMAWWLAPARSEPAGADPRALQEYLRGRHLASIGRPDDAEESLEHFERSVSIDPGFARGHLGLAQAWMRVPGDPAANLSRSRAAVLRALQLDPNLAEAHAHRASLRLYGDWDWAGADEAYRRAIELAPDSAAVRHAYANLLGLRGRHEAAIAQIERAMELDPASTAIKADAGWFYYQATQFERAIELCEVTLELDTANRNAAWCLFQSHRMAGNDASALRAGRRLANLLDDAEAAPEIDRLETFWSWYLTWLERHPDAGTPSAVGLAYLAMGERERAMELFEQAYAAHASCILPLAADPQVDTLRGDARFDELLTRLGLPD